MTDEEFLKKHFEQAPVSVFHGVFVGEGDDIQAIFTNPKIRPHAYAVEEASIFRGIMGGRKHQHVCAQDTRNIAELGVNTEALNAVQDLKERLGIKLDAPRLDSKPRLELIQSELNHGLHSEG